MTDYTIIEEIVFIVEDGMDSGEHPFITARKILQMLTDEKEEFSGMGLKLIEEVKFVDYISGGMLPTPWSHIPKWPGYPE